MSDDTTPAEKPKPKLHPLVAKLLWPLVALGAIGFGWFGYTEWQFEKNRISTDNAQVKGEIIKIFSPEQGYIEAIHVEDNDAVLKGQVLVELANDFYQLQVDQAEANYNLLQAKQGDGDKPGLSDARLESAEANLELIKTQLSTAQDQLRDAQQVVKDLQEQKGKPGFVPSQLTKAIAQSDSLQAKVTTLQQQVTLADKQLAEQQANEKLVGFNLNQAKAELEQAKLRLANTVVKSPIQGYIAQENINPGVLVQSSQYLMSVISLENVWITANIKESQIERVIIGYPVTIVLSAFPSITFYGEVESISPAAGSEFALIPTDNASGNFIKTEALIPVRIRILRTKDFGRLLPGMNATVTILTDPLNDHDETVQKYNKVKAQVEADEEAHGQKTTPAMKETTPAKTDFQAGKQSPEQSPTADTDGAHEALTQGIAEGMETKAESKE